MKRIPWKSVAMLVGGVAVLTGGPMGCTSVFGPPPRSGVTDESPKGGFVPYGGALREPSNNYQPTDPADAADVNRR